MTRDAGEAWKEVSVTAPGNCPKCYPDYSLPKFQDARYGVLQVMFHDNSNLEGRHVTSTYVTHNGGHSWKSISNLEQIGLIESEGAASIEWYHCQVP